MKYVDEFRDGILAANIVASIMHEVKLEHTYRLMEFCGGHTHALSRYGVLGMLPANVQMIHGPGCPVCVLPIGRIDFAIRLALEHDVILCSYGDCLRVPASDGMSLLKAKARGADVRMVYSALDAFQAAVKNPERQVVFFAIGFETTAPATALTVLRARARGVKNFSVFCNHVTIIPAIRAILDSPDMRLDGFIGPGHVSTVIGCRPYEFIARDYRCPIAVSGFEPLDILQSLVMVLRQLREGVAKVENQYARVVPWEGNLAALKVLAEVFEVRPHFEWRGLGFISHSALRLRDSFAAWDAEKTMPIRGICVADPKVAQCGEVLTGVLKPHQCKLFGKECTPEHPVGALMVSPEGACAAHFKYCGAEQPVAFG